MQKINLLPSEIYNKISAGEVVENPASIVKELVENAVDAGSTNIVVEIQDGGITSIVVSDNGVGIGKEHVKNAFKPHATSKISTEKDLENISTLGFRGEALPSISAVASVEMRTKSIEESVGTKYRLKGGVEEEFCDIDCNNGVTMEVRNLFFNTPARHKFLKKPKSEEHEITNIIQGLIFANPNVAIKYIADGKTIYQSNGKGFENAIYSIYPPTITNSLIFIDDQKYDISVKGYIGLPSLTKPNRNFQTTIVNGRLISNNTISTAVSQAYGNMLMKRTFPVFCLEIIMPFDFLDVNVTPNKTDVRFVDNKQVFSSVYNAVRNGLSKNAQYFSVSNEKEEVIDTNLEQTQTTAQNYENINNNNTMQNSFENTIQNIFELHNKNLQEQKADDTQVANTNVELKNEQKPENPLLKQFENIKSDKKFVMPNNSAILKANDNLGFTSVFDENIRQSSMFDEIEEEFSYSSKIVGQIFNTYLIVEKKDSIYIIDQHATHERLIYDKLKSELDEKQIATQPLLTPQIVELSPLDSSVVLDLLEDIKNIGFDIEEFGQNTFKINSIPIILDGFNANKFFNEILQDKYNLSNIKLQDVLHGEIAKKACKSAIKAGQKLKEIEINQMIKQIDENKPMQCPHGRPTIIKLTRKDIDKMFKRIV